MNNKCMGLMGILLVLSISFFGCSGGGGSSTPPPTPPSAPTNLVATAGNSTVGLIWTAVSGAASYNVYRGSATGVLGTKTKIATGLLNAAFDDSTVTNGTTFFYQVTAVNANGESSGSNEAIATPFATATREVFVISSRNDSVTVFDASLSGNVNALRQFGIITGLSTPLGIAVDTVNNEIFVVNKGNTSITVYGRTDSGNIAPVRTISGASTG